ncbi:DUF2235 domain-containing protein [Rhizobium jaguaris]|nr:MULTISPECIES: DUF2235 domain-containing protein [Rhizobium]MDK4743462.1 DUF2235 domain-containing protein [Rhizobium sp. CNPSo 3464]
MQQAWFAGNHSDVGGNDQENETRSPTSRRVGWACDAEAAGSGRRAWEPTCLGSSRTRNATGIFHIVHTLQLATCYPTLPCRSR